MDPRKHCITEPACKQAQAKCVRKQNLLVYDKSNPCVEKSTLPKTCYGVVPLQRANAKRIRVCTGADLKRMCPPKLCACGTQKAARNTGLGASIGRLLGFGVKGALAGGLIYWTYGIGLWGRPDETEQIYIDICKYAYKPDKKEMDRLLQEAREQQTCFNKTCDVFAARRAQMAKDEREAGSEDVLLSEDAILAQMKMCQHAPSIRENTNSFKNKWNRWVLTSFAFIVALPQKLFGEAKDGKEVKKEKPKEIAKEKRCLKGKEAEKTEDDD